MSGIRAMTYQYDQLHRIRQANTFLATGPAQNLFFIQSGEYNTSYTYDGNGNIQTLQRMGLQGQMDNLTYNYNTAGNLPNQLSSVTENLPINTNSLYDNDVDEGQASDNYTYDDIGNLIKDKSEFIDEIKWNVQGKVDTVLFTTAGKAQGRKDIYYTYDPAGNRIRKRIDLGETLYQETVYTRDASGNVMSIYTKNYSYEVNQFVTTITQKEVPLYGSSRLGIHNFNGRLMTNSVPDTRTRTRGQKIFEMSNHLGNVLVAVTDKVLGIGTGTAADYYEADVESANDYYPFGMAMSGRTFSSDSYRYGFNGKENDKSWGTKWIQDYGFRLYNPSIAKFLSVDPLREDYPELTPYQFSSNTPIQAIDLDGLEQEYFQLNFNERTGETCLSKYKELDLFLLGDVKQIYVPELKVTYTFTMFGSGGNPYCAGCGSGNNLDQFDEFISDPVEAVYSGKYKTDESIKQDFLKEMLLTLVLKRALKTSSRNKSTGKLQDSGKGSSIENVKRSDLKDTEQSFVGAYIKSKQPMNSAVFRDKPLSSNALRVMSKELGGKEVAQIFVKTPKGGYYHIIHGSPGSIVIPKYDKGNTPYLISHVHPSGNNKPSKADVSLLKKLQAEQKRQGEPVQKSSQIIPSGEPNAKFNKDSKTYNKDEG